MIKPTSHLTRDRGAAQAQRAGCGGGELTTTISTTEVAYGTQSETHQTLSY